jgi:hypothetical protein
LGTGFKIATGIVAAIALVIFGLGAGWFLWGRNLWAPGLIWGTTECSQGLTPEDQGSSVLGGAPWPGMMQGTSGWESQEDCGDVAGSAPSTDRGTITIEQAQQAIEAYVQNLGYTNLEVHEVMEFEQNFYAIVSEEDTGTGAMELLVDKTTGAVGPETGPNMMWNARYGMHGRGGMMGIQSSENTISEEKALELAQLWLDRNQPGVTTEGHADPFHGYYTIHTMKDGQIEGMLSVHGRTGQVWYHNWHGPFIQMIEQEEHDVHG